MLIIFFLDLSTGLSLGLNKVTYTAIGASATLFILSVTLMVVLMKYFPRKIKGNDENVESLSNLLSIYHCNQMGVDISIRISKELNHGLSSYFNRCK